MGTFYNRKLYLGSYYFNYWKEDPPGCVCINNTKIEIIHTWIRKKYICKIHRYTGRIGSQVEIGLEGNYYVDDQHTVSTLLCLFWGYDL